MSDWTVLWSDDWFHPNQPSLTANLILKAFGITLQGYSCPQGGNVNYTFGPHIAKEVWIWWDYLGHHRKQYEGSAKPVGVPTQSISQWMETHFPPRSASGLDDKDVPKRGWLTDLCYAKDASVDGVGFGFAQIDDVLQGVEIGVIDVDVIVVVSAFVDACLTELQTKYGQVKKPKVTWIDKKNLGADPTLVAMNMLR